MCRVTYDHWQRCVLCGGSAVACVTILLFWSCLYRGAALGVPPTGLGTVDVYRVAVWWAPSMAPWNGMVHSFLGQNGTKCRCVRCVWAACAGGVRRGVWQCLAVNAMQMHVCPVWLCTCCWPERIHAWRVACMPYGRACPIFSAGA